LKIVEEFSARGHPNITATHRTTLEFTKDSTLNKKGDCIVAVDASKGLKDLSETFRRSCKDDKARILVEISSSGIIEKIVGRGCHLLSLSHPEEIVIRRSTYVSERTLMIGANAAAADIDRRLIHKLRSSSTRIRIRLTVET
jgi:hypothetical protein